MEQQNVIKPYVIGLDLGGTNSVFGIVDARGDIKATTAIKTGGYEKVEDYVKMQFDHFDSKACDRVIDWIILGEMPQDIKEDIKAREDRVKKMKGAMFPITV